MIDEKSGFGMDAFEYGAYLEYLRAKEERRRHWMKDT